MYLSSALYLAVGKAPPFPPHRVLIYRYMAKRATKAHKPASTDQAATTVPAPFAAYIATGGSATVNDEAVDEGQVPDVAEPVTGTDVAQDATPTAQDAEGDHEKAFSDKALKEARAEAAKYRKRLRELEAQQQQREEAELSEAERQAKRLVELEQAVAERDEQTRRLALESAVAMRSNALGIVDAEVAVKLLDPAALDFDDAGRPEPESLDQALRRLIKSKPYLKTQPPAASPANPARTEPLGETDEQRRARLFGGGGGMFDPSTAARLGGGVINPKE